MKKHNDFRWVPCSRPTRNICVPHAHATSEEELLLHYATAVAVELGQRETRAGIDAADLANDVEALPVIQI